MKQWLFASLVAGLAWSTALDVYAAEPAPQVISHEGRLLDASGHPRVGLQNITLSLYAAKVGGAAIWSETVEVDLDDGYFAVWLGEATPLPAALLDGKTRWLAVTVGALPRSPARIAVASEPHPMFADDEPVTRRAPPPAAQDLPMSPTAPAAPPAGPQRPAGVVLSAAFADAALGPLSNLSSPAFIGAVVGMTVEPAQLVLVSASAELGSTAPGGASDLHLSICTRRTDSPLLLDDRGSRRENLAVAANSRQTFAVKTRLAGLAPGEYEVGLCGYAKTSASRWNDNDTSRIAVMITA